MTTFQLDIGICMSRELENGHGLAVVNDLRGRPHARLEFTHSPSEFHGKEFYKGVLFPMYATNEYQKALHKALLQAFSVHMMSSAVPGIDFDFVEDEGAKIMLFQEKCAKALRRMTESRHYTLFARLYRAGQQLGEWMVTDPLPVATAVPDAYGR